MRGVRTPELDAPPLRRFGLPEYVKGAQPAAATAFSQDIDGRYFERLITVFCRLVTDANVADRTLYVEYLDPEGNTCLLSGAPVTQSASSTNDYAFQAFHGISDWPVASTVLAPLPPLLLLPTFSWRIAVDNVQAGDQLSRVRFTRERFFTDSPLPGHDAG